MSKREKQPGDDAMSIGVLFWVFVMLGLGYIVVTEFLPRINPAVLR